eukprot:11178464-Lingulodinium_polyedra.AAC.1
MGHMGLSNCACDARVPIAPRSWVRVQTRSWARRSNNYSAGDVANSYRRGGMGIRIHKGPYLFQLRRPLPVYGRPR